MPTKFKMWDEVKDLETGKIGKVYDIGLGVEKTLIKIIFPDGERKLVNENWIEKKEVR